MIKGYPNLELLEYQTKQIIHVFQLEHDKYNPILVEVFPQTWGSTALGFGGVGGQAMTTAYTSVFYDQGQNYAVVFFDGRLAYIVNEPTDLFWEHLKGRRMLPVEEAKIEYDAINEI